MKRLARLSERSGSGRDLLGRRLPKFLDGGTALRDEVFEVTWRTPPGGLGPRSILRFEYRLGIGEPVRSLQRDYPFSVRGRQKSKFVVPLPDGVADGSAVRWRVSLGRGDRILAEKTSAAWR